MCVCGAFLGASDSGFSLRFGKEPCSRSREARTPCSLSPSAAARSSEVSQPSSSSRTVISPEFRVLCFGAWLAGLCSRSSAHGKMQCPEWAGATAPGVLGDESPARRGAPRSRLGGGQRSPASHQPFLGFAPTAPSHSVPAKGSGSPPAPPARVLGRKLLTARARFCLSFLRLVVALELAQRFSFRGAQWTLQRKERRKLNAVGVGPAPWKPLRDRAANDPGLCSVAQKSLGGVGGRRAQGASGFCLAFCPPKRQQKSSQMGCEMQLDPEPGPQQCSVLLMHCCPVLGVDACRDQV